MNENVGLKIKNTKVINKEKAKKTSAKTVLNERGLPNAFSITVILNRGSVEP